MSDKLDLHYINSLPWPLFAEMYGQKWPIESIDVQTGALRIDVSGLLQVSHIDEVRQFVDGDGGIHQPESLYLEQS